jgi:uncharacterized membrane protein
MNAAFFDIFGFFGFLILFAIGIKMLKSKKRLPDWVSIIVIAIALVGLIIDAYNVITNFII